MHLDNIPRNGANLFKIWSKKFLKISKFGLFKNFFFLVLNSKKFLFPPKLIFKLSQNFLLIHQMSLVLNQEISLYSRFLAIFYFYILQNKKNFIKKTCILRNDLRILKMITQVKKVFMFFVDEYNIFLPQQKKNIILKKKIKNFNTINSILFLFSNMFHFLNYYHKKNFLILICLKKNSYKILNTK